MTDCTRDVNVDGNILVCGAPLDKIKVCPFQTDDCYPTDQIIFVIAPSFEWFATWCSVDCVPPENPHDRKFRVIINAASIAKLRSGRHKREGDKILYLGPPANAVATMDCLRQSLMPCGFTECVDQFGRKFPL